MNFGRWALVGLLIAGCSQTPAGQAHATTTPPAPTSASSARSAVAPVSPSPIPSSGNYATAQDAGVAGIEAKTGLTYSSGTCGAGQTCLGAPQVFGNTGAGGYDAAYVQMGYAAAGAGSCYAYVFFANGFWHYTPPVVCPNQSGYNPVLGATDHVAVPGSCANVRLSPGLSSRILDCLKDGTVVSIDPDAPRYVDKHIWWSIDGHRGWMAHDFLITQSG